MNQDKNGLKILILGGTGFLSGTLAKKALLKNNEVWTLSRGNHVAEDDGRNVLIADRHEADRFKRVIEAANIRWDTVIDCIGMNPEDARQDIDVLSHFTKQIIFISTDSVYDPFHKKIPQNEDSDYYLTEGYGGNKRLCELEFLHSDMGETFWTIIRPGHIFGPGSQLGCFPLHARDKELLHKLREGKTISLVGGGHFLQQPIFAPDLCDMLLSFIGNEKTYNQIFCVAGPEIIESKKYYEMIAEILGVAINFAEIPIDAYYSAHPEDAPFLCHRVYDLSKLRSTGAAIPSTSMIDGLRLHVKSLL
ncbi:MAG TPA: NAD-dependent epimerase/dehydratase family protein [Bacillota bacterium]